MILEQAPAAHLVAMAGDKALSLVRVDADEARFPDLCKMLLQVLTVERRQGYAPRFALGPDGAAVPLPAGECEPGCSASVELRPRRIVSVEGWFLGTPEAAWDTFGAAELVSALLYVHQEREQDPMICEFIEVMKRALPRGDKW